MSELPHAFEDWLGKICSPEIQIKIHETSGLSQHVDPPSIISSQPWLDYSFWFIFENSFQLQIENQLVSLYPGMLLFLSPQTLFSFTSRDLQPVVTLHYLRFNFFPHHFSFSFPEKYFILQEADSLASSLELVLKEKEFPRISSNYKIKFSLCSLLIDSFRLRAESQKSVPVLTSHQRMQLTRFIRLENLSKKIKPEDLAKALHLSKHYFARLFRKTYGISPQKWIIQEKIRHATYQLNYTNLSVQEISKLLGFKNMFFFSRQFKQIMKMSPKQYRMGKKQIPSSE